MGVRYVYHSVYQYVVLFLYSLGVNWSVLNPCIIVIIPFFWALLLQDLDLFHQFDHVFWFGDLNYRVDREYAEVIERVAERDWATLQQSDQLITEMSRYRVFPDFQEVWGYI